MKNKTQWDEITWHLKRLEHPLQYLIACTPTGPIREALTEANINFLLAEAALVRAAEMAKKEKDNGHD